MEKSNKSCEELSQGTTARALHLANSSSQPHYQSRLSQSQSGYTRLGVAQRSFNDLGFRVTRSATRHNEESFDMVALKRQVDEEIDVLDEDLAAYSAKGARGGKIVISKLRDALAEFRSIPPVAMAGGNGHAMRMVLKLRRLLNGSDGNELTPERGRELSVEEKTYIVQALFLLSSCARLENMAHTKELLTVVQLGGTSETSRHPPVPLLDLSPPNSPPGSPRSDGSRSPHSPHHQSTSPSPRSSPNLLASSPRSSASSPSDRRRKSSFPTPLSLEDDARSTTPDIKEVVDVISEMGGSGGPKRKARPRLELQKLVMCRICERNVPIGKLQRHSKRCEEHNKWELRSLEIDESLVELLRSQEVNIDKEPLEGLHFLKEVLDVVERARRASAMGDAEVLQQLSDQVSKLRKRERDEIVSPRGPREDVRGRRLSAAPRLEEIRAVVDGGVDSKDGADNGAKEDGGKADAEREAQERQLRRRSTMVARVLSGSSVSDSGEELDGEDTSSTSAASAPSAMGGAVPPSPIDRRRNLRKMQRDSVEMLMGKRRPTRFVKPNPRVQLLSSLSKLLTRKKACVRKMKDSFDTLSECDEASIQVLKVPSIRDFEIIKPITRGGFACVYLGKKKSTGDVMAIKVLKKQEMLNQSQVDNVIAERDILANTSCPYVVRLYYAFKTQENLCMAMEFLSGGDLCTPLIALAEMEGHCCGLDEDTVRFYIAETVQALEYLHSKGIIHRDLKPDNMLIANNGHVKLTDFGLSHFGLSRQTQGFWSEIKDSARSFKLRGAKKQQNEVVEVTSQSIVGTPDYLAPEVLLGLAHGPGVDYWALGVIMFELMTGIPPFTGQDPQEIFENILNKTFCVTWDELLQEGISPEAVDLIQKLLNDDAKVRLGANGADEVKQHPWFKDIKWDTLRKQEANFKPQLNDSTSTEYFEARAQYWPMIEEDFGLVEEDLRSSTSVAGPSEEVVAADPTADEAELLRRELKKRISLEEGPFGSFWCINARNLRERNEEITDEMLTLLGTFKKSNSKGRNVYGSTV